MGRKIIDLNNHYHEQMLEEYFIVDNETIVVNNKLKLFTQRLYHIIFGDDMIITTFIFA